MVGRPANLSGMTRWREAVLWATALTSGLTSGESAVRLVVGRVPAFVWLLKCPGDFLRWLEMRSVGFGEFCGGDWVLGGKDRASGETRPFFGW